MTDPDERYITVEGDLPKIGPTTQHFVELRASLRNALDVQCEMGMEVALLIADRDNLREALVDLRDAANAYVSDDIGIGELAESMDKAFDAISRSKVRRG